MPAVRDRPDAIDPGRVRGLIEFADVSFSYDGKRAAVADLKFTALPGETVALVGPTGAGKSTALALLHRVFDPQSGSVKIDGMDIRGLQACGAAPEHRRGVPGGAAVQPLDRREPARRPAGGDRRRRLREAAARAQALDFIERNPEGFEASVGERGRMLSGGERQRISIARALLKNPPILILDEATSALDATTEMKVQAALDEVMKDRTTFVIAHRLSTVRNATRILVFDQGRIVETGSFDELIRKGGAFAALAKAQFLVGEHRRGADARRHAAVAPRRPRGEARRAAAEPDHRRRGGIAALLLDPLQHADVVRHRRAAHVEDAGELGVRHLDVAGRAGKLHGAERVHRHAGRADRMALGLQPAGRIDRQLAVLLRPAFLDRARALPFRHEPHRLVFDQFGDGEAVVRLDERQIAERDAGVGERALPGLACSPRT